jgi:hypothetical protein
MREQRLPLTIKQNESSKQKAAKLQLGQTKYTSSADVSLAASKLYASAIQKAQESIKVQDQNLRSLHSAAFTQANYMQNHKYSKTPHVANHEQKCAKANVKRRTASINNNDIEDVLALNFACSLGSASSSGEEDDAEIYNDLDMDEVREQESSPEADSNDDDDKRPVFQDLPKSPRLKKELVDIFNKENGYSLEN